MKNIDDDEILMIEKISTKEIYGKAQKVKISDMKKETEKIRIEIDRLKVVVHTKENLVKEKETQITNLKHEIEKLKTLPQKTHVVYKTEYKTSPEVTKQLQFQDSQLKQKDQEIYNLKNAAPQIKTVISSFAFS